MEAPEYLDLDEIDFSDDAVVSFPHRPDLQIPQSACRPPSADGINSSLNITTLHSCRTAVCNYYLTNIPFLFFRLLFSPLLQYSVTSLKSIPELSRRSDGQAEERQGDGLPTAALY